MPGPLITSKSPDVDLRSNIRRGSAGKNRVRAPDRFLPRAGSEDGLQFLMTREITHLKAFMVALEAMSKDPLSIGLIRQRQRWLTSISTLRPVRAIWAKPIFSGHGTITISTERVDAPAFRISLIRSWALEPPTKLKPRTFRANARRLVRPCKKMRPVRQRRKPGLAEKQPVSDWKPPIAGAPPCCRCVGDGGKPSTGWLP